MAKPKLALIPAAQGSKFYSVLPSSGVGDFDFTRSGSATRINSQGLIESVANGVSRLNYPMIDGVVKGCPHHILEPQRTNLITYSEDFSQWASNGGTVTSNQTISPSGTLNADKLSAFPNNGQHRLDFASSNVAGETTFSFFAKSVEYNSVWARIGLSTVFFDLENGESQNNTSATTSSTEYYGNGWYRCIMTKEISSANEICRINLTQSYKDSSIFIGDGTSGIYIYGAQFEQGSYPTSYIPTNGSTVTRSAETANGSGDASTFNDSEGVLFADIAGLVDADDYRIISLNAGNSTASIFLGLRNDTGNVYMYMPTDSTSYISNVNATNKFTKIALKYKTNDVSFFINGFKVFTDNTVTLPTGLNQLDFNYGNSTDSYPFYGKAKQIQYYDSALTDNELETLTSWVSFQDMAEGQLYTIE
jgi:hypothetical protein